MIAFMLWAWFTIAAMVVLIFGGDEGRGAVLAIALGLFTFRSWKRTAKDDNDR